MSISKTIKKFLREQKVKKILKTSKIGATTDLVIFHIKRNSDSIIKYDNLKLEFIKSSNHIRGAVGRRYISIIVSEQYHDKLYNLFNENIVSIQKKVASILVDCSRPDNKGEAVSGIINYITSLLSEKNINLYSFFTSQDEITLIIDEENAYKYVDLVKKKLKA